MPRGGRRPGAGAPKGNLNALKDGRTSPRILLLVFALLRLPLFRQFLLRQLAKNQKAIRRRQRNRQLEALARAITTQAIASGILHNVNNQTAGEPPNSQREISPKTIISSSPDNSVLIKPSQRSLKK